MRISSLQYPIRPVQSFGEFADHAAAWVKNAAEYKSQMVVFPEYFTLSLLSLGNGSAPLPEQLKAVAAYRDRFVESFGALARQYKVSIVAGTIPALQAHGAIHNESHVFSASGAHAFQSKLHMTRFEKEDFGVSAPAQPVLRVFEAEWGRFAVAICYDVEFPELVRAAVRGGAELIVVPSCTDDRQGYYRVRYCAQARTVENQVFVVQSSTVGGLTGWPAACLNYGQSALLTPNDYGFARDGVLAEGVAGVESMVVGDLDFELLRKSRTDGSVLPLTDSREGAAAYGKVDVVRL